MPCRSELHLHHKLGCARSRKPHSLYLHLPRADRPPRYAGLLESFEQPAPLRRQLQPQAGVHCYHAGSGFVKGVKLMKYPAFYVRKFVLFGTYQENVDFYLILRDDGYLLVVHSSRCLLMKLSKGIWIWAMAVLPQDIVRILVRLRIFRG